MKKPLLIVEESSHVAFRKRLQRVLAQAGYDSVSASQITREFNHRFPEYPVTMHAVSKWLDGETIPSQKRLYMLSAWLNVSADWLKYGMVDQNDRSIQHQLPCSLPNKMNDAAIPTKSVRGALKRFIKRWATRIKAR